MSLFDDKELIESITSTWEGERFENGRPKVSDELIERFRDLTIEEIYTGIWNQHSRGYEAQFQNGFLNSHPDKVLIGRAVTAVMAPSRLDLHASLTKIGDEDGREGFYNSWIIQIMQKYDVMVVDMFDKILEGTFVGGNLTTGIEERTEGTGGAVIWGGVRDLDQIRKKSIPTFYRGYDPTGIKNVVMVGLNVPCRIGEAICLPGDLVYANCDGVVFIPPQLAENVARTAEQTKVRDVFAFQRIDEKVYTVAQIDRSWTKAIWDDFLVWFDEECPKKYRQLTWEDIIEKELAKQTQDLNN
ncbi:MAG: RraA family protein [Lentisphaeria bacterium]|nr:RraA family protein [Lentisphaeria bacterium]NQZ66587.1 RraA family protein [Lentisphaeria bacterium]